MPEALAKSPNTRLHEAATAARRAGDLPAARDMLLAAGIWNDPHLVMLTVLILNDLEDSAALQTALTSAIAALAQMQRAGDEYLIFLHRRAEQYCLDATTRAPLLRLIASRIDPNTPSPQTPLARVWVAGQQRAAFARHYADRHNADRGPVPSFIPLGLNCMPWVLANRWGLHAAEAYRRNLGPFAMAVHTVPGIIAALRDDFATYTDPGQIMTIPAPGGRPIVMRKDRGATWVHHDNPYYFTDTYANLRANMAERAAAMRAACKAEKPVFMMNFVNVDYPNKPIHFLAALHDALHAFTSRRDYFLFMSNTIHAHEGPQVHTVDDRTCFFYCTAPEKGFQWNVETNLDTPKSMEFERTYIARIEACLTRWKI